MNKKIIFSVVAGLILISGTVFLISTSDSEEVAVNNISENNNQVVEEEVEIQSSTNESAELNEVSVAEGVYIDYSEQVLADSSYTKRVVFFHAPWCSTCNFYEGQIEDQGVPNGVTILKVDFDSETDLKTKYGVNVQSTFVLLDENGDVVKSWPFARGLSGIQDLYGQI